MYIKDIFKEILHEFILFHVCNLKTNVLKLQATMMYMMYIT